VLNPILNASSIASIWGNRQLIRHLIQREIVGRYKGSFMGIIWSLLNPVFMLTIYTFVFSTIFKARWGSGPGEESKIQFATILFAGMIVNGLFTEVLNRAPGLILSNTTYVKKVVFPLEILSIVNIGSALFHCAVSLIVLIAAILIVDHHIHWTVLYVPLVLLPFTILSLGLSWILSSLGVFLRDVSQTVGLLTTVLGFLAPVFYPMSALPERYASAAMLNPLTLIVVQMRSIVIWGEQPDFEALLIYTAIATFIACGGFFWFQKTRGAFADVL